MAILTCESCQMVFAGRPNRRFCSIPCRRKAEMKEREIKTAERRQVMLAAMLPTWKDLPTDWGKPTVWGTPEQQKAWEDELVHDDE